MENTSRTEPIDLGAAAERVARLAEGIDDDRLDDPTPCPEYAVREVLAHVAGLSVAFRDAARKHVGPTTATPPGSFRPVLTEDWRTALPRALGELAAAWREPGAWEGDTQAGGVRLPAAVMGRVALDELLVHGWDLARASGQAYEVSEEELRVSEALLAPADDSSDEGFFGPVVAVPDTAPLLDRVIGLSGRRPDWRPAPS
ncbi:TIGR03086 family metal-binding protein [Streptomyces sp. NPDC020472]|uniref:TIGR03086 family metal-binding protein n=1 Tax=Streptomyces sp. NPDC020472 TaxID=3365075 RepID=UPI0037B7C41B